MPHSLVPAPSQCTVSYLRHVSASPHARTIGAPFSAHSHQPSCARTHPSSLCLLPSTTRLLSCFLVRRWFPRGDGVRSQLTEAL
ncbi:hypothetical protein B0H19DRAFT_1172377 [Mycena capillaripes]|nr:hypothetical protein B0H19DRAFT_1172377 [Mycena capillaripes]